MDKKIFIAGYTQSKFGKLFKMSLEEMIRKTLRELTENLDPKDIDTVSIGTCLAPVLNKQYLLSGLAAMEDGFASKSIETTENACASGGQAILNIIHKLRSGFAETGIAVGVEKMRDDEGKMNGKAIGEVLGIASHPDDRIGKLFVFPHIFAEIMKTYMNTYAVSEKELAHIPVLFYENACKNPKAQMNGVKITIDDVLRIEGINRYIIDGLPLKTYDCSQVSDGYAGMLLCTEKGATQLSIKKENLVEICGFSQVTDPLRIGTRDVLKPKGAYKAIKEAYDLAKISASEISLAEVHDCFTIMAAISAEIIGKADLGRGAKYFMDGKAHVSGECPINTSGGLMGKGHPIGATGIAMPGWIYEQMTGKVPPSLQVKNIRYGVSFNIGGPLSASVVFVLKK